MTGYCLCLKLYFLLSKIISPRNRPIYNLGRIAVFSFLIAFITGIYLFLFYRIDPLEAYNSTEAISRQWLGSIIRSMHRYSSDLLVLAIILHFLHALIKRSFRKKFSWLTGLFSLGIVIAIGITGFVLVWDQKAKLIGLLSVKLISVLPFFSPSLSGLFLVEDLKAMGGFFRVSFVAHFFLSLFLLVLIYLHVTRIGMRKFLPSSFLIYAIALCLLLMAFLLPVSSDLPANSTILPYHSTYDWYYFAGFYSMKFITAKELWLIGISFTAVLLLLPSLKRKIRILNVRTREKRRWMNNGFSLSFLLLFAFLPFLSNTNITFYPPKQKMFILNFKYVSSATETKTYQTELKHMKYSAPLVKSRSPVEIQVLSEHGTKLYSRIFEPSGFRKNSAIFVYDEISINQKIKVRLSEVNLPEMVTESPLIDLKSSMVISFRNNRFHLSSEN